MKNLILSACIFSGCVNLGGICDACDKCKDKVEVHWVPRIKVKLIWEPVVTRVKVRDRETNPCEEQQSTFIKETRKVRCGLFGYKEKHTLLVK